MGYAQGMPLELSPQVIDRFGSSPMYRQLADHIREAIAGHKVSPGELLPAEPAVAKAAGLSVDVVREALDVLVGEGLIVRRRGSGTRVVEPPPVRQMGAGRYLKEMELLRAGGEHPATSAFAEEHGVTLDKVIIDVDYAKDKANELDAEYLKVKLGSPVMRRHMLKYADGQPTEIQRSTVPYEIAKGTILADPKAQPVPGGTMAELWSAGIVVDPIAKYVTARMPSNRERQQLRMEATGPVLDLVRVMSDEDGRPVEVSRIIVPANRNILYYEISLRSTD